MGRRKAVGTTVWRITGGVVQRDVVQTKPIRVGDVEAVYRPVLNVEVFDHRGTVGLADSHKVIGLGDAAIGTQAIPPGLAVTVDNGVRFGGDEDVCTSNFDEIDVAVEILERCPSSEGDGGASLQLCQVKRLTARYKDVRKCNCSARLYRSGNIGVLGHCAITSGRGGKVSNCSQGSGPQDYREVSFSTLSILAGVFTLGSHF